MSEEIQLLKDAVSRDVILAPGTPLAGRFRVEKYMGVEIIGGSYLATDERDARHVAVTLIPPELVRGPNILDRIKEEIKSSTQIAHKNVQDCLGMGSLPDGSFYLTAHYIEGQKLYQVLERRREHGKHFSLRGAYNIIAHLCGGLEAVHRTRVHGTLCPFSVRITMSGRVKIADLPLSRLYYLLPAMKKEVSPYVSAFWAPEVAKGGSVITARADVYSLGVLLYELLTLSLPEEEGVSVRAARDDLPESIDEIIARCLDPDPAARWMSVQALRKALHNVHKEYERESAPPPKPEDDILLDLEIDVEHPIMKAPPPPPPPKGKRPAPPVHGLPGAPAAAAVGPVQDHRREPRPTKEPKGRKSKASRIDLDRIVTNISDEDAEKWMITKDGMDHGPFRARDVVGMINRWEVEGQHTILDLEKGNRAKLRDAEEFKEIVEKARVAKQRKEEMEALASSEKAEKRGGIAKVFIVIAVLGGIGVLVGGYFLTRAALERFSGGGKEVNLADSSIKINVGQGGIVKDKRAGGKGGKRKGGGGGGGGGMSYEDYMNTGVDLGSVEGDGGQMQLTQGQINAVMSSQGKKVYPCIYAEMRRSPGLKKVSLKFAIEGKTGNVMGVSVTSGGSSELQSCMSAKMKQVNFPAFSSPRMGATFYFDVGS